MKEKIKAILADLVYWLYEKNILRNRLHVMGMEETIQELCESGKSLVRFGDSDIVMMCGRETIVQDRAPKLGERIARILRCEQENLLVGIPDIFEGLSQYTEKSQRFWKNHLLLFRRVYVQNCVEGHPYCNAFLSRMYYNYADKSQCGTWIAGFRRVWDQKPLVVVEGAGTHNGVGNDLLDNAAGVERIICPPTNAWQVYDRILEACLAFGKEKMFLISLGSTAKALTSDLTQKGYRVIDIGNLDMEYEWFLAKAEKKEAIPKHSVIGPEANGKAGYQDYLSQVRQWIEL